MTENRAGRVEEGEASRVVSKRVARGPTGRPDVTWHYLVGLPDGQDLEHGD